MRLGLHALGIGNGADRAVIDAVAAAADSGGFATLWSGVYPMTSGVLSLEGGGLWTMTCKVEYAAKGWE